MSEAWYCIYTNPNQETRAEEHLRAWNVTTFVPAARQPKSGNNPACVSQPLFPRYIFARFNAGEVLHRVRFTRGVQAVVGFGSGPTPIGDEVIGMIQARMGEDGFIDLAERCEPGERVEVKAGPFQNMHGIFVRDLDHRRRVLILLEAMSLHAWTEMEREQIRRVN